MESGGNNNQPGYSLIIGGRNDNTGIDRCQREILRLIREQMEFLQELMATPDLIKNEMEDRQKRNLDRRETQLWTEILASEAQKIERLEMTLAVVGTMKAGKSTTINAIVGTEVLPNRNQPMTTMPTIIRHRPGQRVPVLTFTRKEPFNNAVTALKEALQHKYVWGELDQLPFMAYADGRKLINDILCDSFSGIRERYQGQDEIYQFLKAINDLSRLCDYLGLPSPLTEYEALDELPAIEVEFFHLRNNQSSFNQGKFALIDTPGPNEAGQSKLKEILRQQLAKASAVMAIFDYTQLNSEAETEIRDVLAQVSGLNNERLYVLVNKFDQKDRNGMGAEETREYVSSKLLGNRLGIEHIYPVSSRYGYLANRALNEISQNRFLPDPGVNSWVEDFGELALGTIWQNKIHNPAEVEQCARELWKSSNFQQPLAEIIQSTYRDAALISIKSALDKMNTYGSTVNNYLDLRSSAINADIREIQEQIATFERYIGEIQKTEEEAYKFTFAGINKLQQQIRQLFEDTNRDLHKMLSQWFWEDSYRDLMSLRDKKMSFFPTKEEAGKYLSELYNTVINKIEPILTQMQKLIGDEVSGIEEQLWNGIYEKLRVIFEAAQQRLNETFTVVLTFPKPALKSIQIDLEALQTESIEKTTIVEYDKKQERRWYTLWIYPHEVEYTFEDTVYKVNSADIGKRILYDLDEYQRSMEKALNDYVELEMKKTVDEYFREIFSYLERFRGDLSDTRSDHELTEEKLVSLRENILKLSSRSKAHSKEVAAVREEAEKLFGNEQVKEHGREYPEIRAL